MYNQFHALQNKALCALALASVLVASSFAQTVNAITRISQGINGQQPNEDSINPFVSANGRYVVYSSLASNLVAGDSNNAYDVFWVDTQTGQTQRVSVAGNGTQSNDFSAGASVSGDGRFVVFRSHANNLVANDTNGSADIFVRDIQLQQTRLINLSSTGTQATVTDADDWAGINPVISDDGSHIAYVSEAANLVAGDNNFAADVFIHRMSDQSTTRVSTNSSGQQGNGNSGNSGLRALGGARHIDISANGRRVVFVSDASNLVPGDTNQNDDVFFKDLDTGQTRRMSLLANGSQSNALEGSINTPRISGDGNWIAFETNKPGFVPEDTDAKFDIYARAVTGTTNFLVTRNYLGAQSQYSPGFFYGLDISSTGRFVSFRSFARDYVPNISSRTVKVYLRDLEARKNYELITRRVDDERSVFGLDLPISADARTLVLDSDASYLVNNDINSRDDVFKLDLADLSALQFSDGFDQEAIPGRIYLSGPSSGLANNGSTVGLSWEATYVPKTGTPCRATAGPPSWLAQQNLTSRNFSTFVMPGTVGTTVNIQLTCRDDQGVDVSSSFALFIGGVR
jgi:WD40-like Beta Propeller Repeat